MTTAIAIKENEIMQLEEKLLSIKDDLYSTLDPLLLSKEFLFQKEDLPDDIRHIRGILITACKKLDEIHTRIDEAESAVGRLIE
jgi:hypothetical protein